MDSNPMLAMFTPTDRCPVDGCTLGHDHDGWCNDGEPLAADSEGERR